MQDAFKRLLDRSRGENELAAAATLLRLKSSGRSFDPLLEAQELAADMMDLIQAPLTGLARLRLLLMLYAQLIEMEDVHHVLANLLLVSHGHPYQAHPFGFSHEMPAYLDHADIRRMVHVVSTMAHRAEEEVVLTFYQSTCFPPLVEAFRASAYALSPPGLQIHVGELIDINGRPTRTLALEWLFERLWRFVSTFVGLMAAIGDAVRQFARPDQVLTGHLREPFEAVSARAHVEEGIGLVGLRQS